MSKRRQQMCPTVAPEEHDVRSPLNPQSCAPHSDGRTTTVLKQVRRNLRKSTLSFSRKCAIFLVLQKPDARLKEQRIRNPSIQKCQNYSALGKTGTIPCSGMSRTNLEAELSVRCVAACTRVCHRNVAYKFDDVAFFFMCTVH